MFLGMKLGPVIVGRTRRPSASPGVGAFLVLAVLLGLYWALWVHAWPVALAATLAAITWAVRRHWPVLVASVRTWLSGWHW